MQAEPSHHAQKFVGSLSALPGDVTARDYKQGHQRQHLQKKA